MADAGISFGDYRLLRRIARGGMAEVFLARQAGSGFSRLVALKRILPKLIDDESSIRMFHSEAKLASRLSHPNIVHIYDVGKVGDHLFIAMEFVEGLHCGDLIRKAAQSPLPAHWVARIGADACAGLHYAHTKRDEEGNPLHLVHRDVSPPNIAVSYEGVVKLLDFGIAKAVDSLEQTKPGIVKGKYGYMSPEQTVGRKLDHRSDVFSLALVLWELLAGKSAVPRDQLLAMKTIRDGKVPSIDSVRKDLPPPLCLALEGALHRDADKRSSALEFGTELERYLKDVKAASDSLSLGAFVLSLVGERPELSAADEALTSLHDPVSPAPAEERGSVVRRLSDLAADNQPGNQACGVRGDSVSGDLAYTPAPTTLPADEGRSVVLSEALASNESSAESEQATEPRLEIPESPSAAHQTPHAHHAPPCQVESKGLSASALVAFAAGVALATAVAFLWPEATPRESQASDSAPIGTSEAGTTPKEQKVQLLTEPPGAELFIEGQGVGQSPLSLSLEEGSYTLLVRNAEAAEIERKLVVRSGQDLRLEILLPPAMPASHEREDGPNPEERSIAGDGGESKEVAPSPTALGQMDIESIPRGAGVYLGGERIGRTPLQRSLAPGEYEFELRRRGHRREKLRISIVADERSEHRVYLKRRH